MGLMGDNASSPEEVACDISAIQAGVTVPTKTDEGESQTSLNSSELTKKVSPNPALPLRYRAKSGVFDFLAHARSQNQAVVSREVMRSSALKRGMNLNENGPWSKGVRRVSQIRGHLNSNGGTDRFVWPEETEGGDQFVFNGIADPERRVLRVAHLPFLEELYTMINQKLYKEGMSEDFSIYPIINSTIRAIKQNGGTNGSSRTSFHLTLNAIDFSNWKMSVENLKEGSQKTMQMDKSFREALAQSLYELTQNGDAKVRMHGRGSSKHFHVVVMLKDGGKKLPIQKSSNPPAPRPRKNDVCAPEGRYKGLAYRTIRAGRKNGRTFPEAFENAGIDVPGWAPSDGAKKLRAYLRGKVYRAFIRKIKKFDSGNAKKSYGRNAKIRVPISRIPGCGR